MFRRRKFREGVELLLTQREHPLQLCGLVEIAIDEVVDAENAFVLNASDRRCNLANSCHRFVVARLASETFW